MTDQVTIHNIRTVVCSGDLPLRPKLCWGRNVSKLLLRFTGREADLPDVCSQAELGNERQNRALKTTWGKRGSTTAIEAPTAELPEAIRAAIKALVAACPPANDGKVKSKRRSPWRGFFGRG